MGGTNIPLCKGGDLGRINPPFGKGGLGGIWLFSGTGRGTQGLAGSSARIRIQRADDAFGVGLGEDERGLDLEHVVVGAVRAHRAPLLPQSLNDVGRLKGGRGPGRPVQDELDPEKQAQPADVSDKGVPFAEPAQPGFQRGADPGGVLLQLFVLHDVEHREAGGAGHRITAERIEVLHAIREGVRDCWVVVTTAPSGKPLPIGLPMVTISGTTLWVSNPQKCVPTRPKPTWTSSAMHSPPASLTAR